MSRVSRQLLFLLVLEDSRKTAREKRQGGEIPAR